MTADGKLPPAEKRGYKNVFNALTRIVKEEGTATLWKVKHASRLCPRKKTLFLSEFLIFRELLQQWYAPWW